MRVCKECSLRPQRSLPLFPDIQTEFTQRPGTSNKPRRRMLSHPPERTAKLESHSRQTHSAQPPCFQAKAHWHKLCLRKIKELLSVSSRKEIQGFWWIQKPVFKRNHSMAVPILFPLAFLKNFCLCVLDITNMCKVLCELHCFTASAPG